MCAGLLALHLAVANAPAQEEHSADTSAQTRLVSIEGSASLTADFYDFDADPSGAQAGRRPPRLYRLVINPTITIGGFLSLPFNIMLTLPETNVSTPAVQSPTFGQYILNPANALGFSSFSPRIGWAQGFLGSHSPQYSTLTSTDLPLFGAGIDLQPFGMRLAASGGIVQRAVEPDSAAGSRGSYRRDLYMGRFGTAKNDTMEFGVNMVFASDDNQSLQNNIIAVAPAYRIEGDTDVIVPSDTIRLRPEEGLMASADFRYAIAEGVSISAEAAMTSFTRDQSAALKTIEGNPLDAVTTTRVSTRVDIAGTAALVINTGDVGLTISSLYMGAGYVPIAQPYQQADRFEWRVAPSFRMFDGDLAMNATVGHRINNVSATKGETLSQLLVSGNINAQFTEELSLLLRYSNFGIRNDRTQDTLRIQNVSQSYGIEPSVVVSTNWAIHTMIAGLGLDTYDDVNIVTGAESSNDMRSATFNYLAAFTGLPLTVGMNGSYLENKLFTGTFIVRSVGGIAAYRLASGTVLPSVSVTNSTTSFASGSADSQLFFKAALRWRITPTLSCSASYGTNDYVYGSSSRRGTGFSERLVQLAMTTTF